MKLTNYRLVIDSELGGLTSGVETCEKLGLNQS